MSLLIAELRAYERSGDLDRQLGAGDPLAEAQHIGIVVLDRLVGRVRLARKEGARAAYLASGDARPGSRPAHHDAAIGLAAHDRLSRGAREVRIIDGWRGSVRSQVEERQVGL